MELASFNFKVFLVIISRYFILMMNKLIRFKISFQLFLHYEAMFKNITMCIAKRMIRFFDRPISVAQNPAAFPVTIFATEGPKMNNLIFTTLRASRIFKFLFLFGSFFAHKAFHCNHGYNDTRKGK